MKNGFCLLALLLCFSCRTPAKLLEKGRVDEALELSLKLLSDGRIKSVDIVALEEATHIIAQRDDEQVQYWLQQQDSSLWPLIYEYAKLVDEQQEKVRQVQQRLMYEGYRPRLTYYPAQAIMERARGASAHYYYGTVQQRLPAARAGDRQVARAAYDSIKLCRQYLQDFRNAEALEEELFDLGLTHILLRPRAGKPDGKRGERLMAMMVKDERFPQRSNWLVFHQSPPEQRQLHYLLDYYFTDYYVSPDREDRSSCRNTEEVEDGVIVEEEWSEEDSAYVEVEKPRIIEVSVKVTEYEQSKSANVELRWQLRRLEDEAVIYESDLKAWDRWSNEYTRVSGDERALGGSCRDSGGSSSSHPSDWDMLSGAAHSLKRKFWKSVDRSPWLENPDN
ncbi:MAG: hypothetical protein GVY26_18715 [Bacteroidetes bacterium]|jgi:hypothetical protein|nr:hypothetical protein [Bacteroidota bacterium]